MKKFCKKFATITFVWEKGCNAARFWNFQKFFLRPLKSYSYGKLILSPPGGPKAGFAASMMLLLLFFCAASPAVAQVPLSDSGMTSRFDSLIAKLPVCGATASYFKSLVVDTNQGGTALRASTATSPSGFPASAKVRCGKFELYYEDLLPGNPTAGFGDPTLGATRRNTFCAVLNYIQGIVDFSKIPTSAPIRIQVLQSYSQPQNPAPPNTHFFAQAGPFRLSNATTPVGGFARDYTVTGIDPAPAASYHGALMVNFDKVFDANGNSYPIFWQDDYATALGKCNLDLYSVLLHECTHIMGWISLIDYTQPNPPSPNGPFSRIDNSIRIGNPNHNPTVTNPLPLTKLINNNTLPASYTPGGDMWLDGSAPPENVPVFSGGESILLAPRVRDNTDAYKGSYISHIDDYPVNWPIRNRVSPGEIFHYVMGPFGLEGVLKREYTKHEVKALSSILGYSYTSSFSNTRVTLLTNKVPYSTRMISPSINSYFPVWQDNQPDNIQPDFTITNNVGTTLQININTRPEFVDPDGDPKSVKPGSLINFRGCGNGGNNHNQLSVSANGQIITYTPRPNFVGLAQFGFTLWDGKEKGTFVLYTIKVNSGTNVTLPASGELVLNGGFEEGTEVTRFGADEVIDNSLVDGYYSGRFQDMHFSDSHPLDYLSHAVAPGSGGIFINKSFAGCGSTALPNTTYMYGHSINSCAPSIFLPGIGQPPIENINGQRYKGMLDGHAFFHLAKPVQPNAYYMLKFDAYYPTNSSITPPSGISFTTEATAGLSSLNWQQSLNPTTLYDVPCINPVITGTGVWKHFVIHFQYGNVAPADILILKAILAPNYIRWFVDNVSLKLKLPPPCDQTSSAIVLREGVNTACGNLLPATATALLNYFGNPTSNTIATTVPIVIEGKFKVDKNITFSGSNIRFANPGTIVATSGMEVNAGKTLTITNSTLKAGCGVLWNGIRVPANAGAITVTGSTISDMTDGIEVIGDAPATFSGNQFKDNLYNLKLYYNTLNHNLVINGNTFSTSSALLLPPHAGRKSQAGILVSNCRKLPVGLNAASNTASNTFDNLLTGISIDIDGSFPISGGTAATTGIDYRLFNNDFKNIQGGYFGIPSSNGTTFTDLYSDPAGTAIFVKNAMKAIDGSCRMQISYLGGNTAGIRNCTKAVTISRLSLDASNVKIQDGVWGFSLGRAETGIYKLSGNQMSNIYRGIDINGTPDRADITTNSYVSPPNGNFSFNGYPVGNRDGDPVGISLTNFSSLSGNRALLEGNTVTINSVGGTGILLQNTGKGVVLNKNILSLPTWQTGNGTKSVLLGVSLNNCNGTSLLNNQVTGNASLNFSGHPTITTLRDNVAGFSISSSPGLQIKSNQISFIKYGFLVISDCATARDAVAGNCFLYHQNAMLFRQLGAPGSFGDIGDARTDNNNRFNGTIYSLPRAGGPLMKVFTVMARTGQRSPNIYTNTTSGNISQNESGSNVPGSEYRVINNNINPTVSPACTLVPVLTITGGSNNGLMLYDTSGAIAVAKDSVVYPYFPDVAKWIADKDLYEILSRAPGALASKPEFALFFAQKDATLMKYVQNADSLLAGMSDSAIWSDHTTWEQWLADAKGENNGIASGDVQEENERLINDAYMRYLEGGFDTLNNETDSTLIASLALSCPYVNGTAVYKARMLYSYWAPAETYTDLEICNAVGFYKGGRSWLDEQNDLLNSFQLAGQDGNVKLAEMERQGLVISPNPGTGLFKIMLSGNAAPESVLKVSNLLGQEIARVLLKGTVTEMSLKGQPAGVYYYQWQVGSRTLQSGKIVLNP